MALVLGSVALLVMTTGCSVPLLTGGTTDSGPRPRFTQIAPEPETVPVTAQSYTDREDNVLCLCPNHHVLFDRGGLVISDDLRIVDPSTGAVVGRLRTALGHNVSDEQLAYHRGLFRTT